MLTKTRFSGMRYTGLLLSLLTFLWCATSTAQLSTGKVEGTVRDTDTGQPLQGAQVVIEGTRLGNVTNNDGYYFVLNIPPGRRNITFTYTGYQKTTVVNQLILAGQTTTIDGLLSSTVVQLEGITVQGESDVLLPRDNTVTKHRLTREKLTETPGTTLEDLIVLVAGVEVGGEGAKARGLRIRGGRLGEEGMVVDGVMVRNHTADVFSDGSWSGNAEEAFLSADATPLEFSISAVEEVDIITGGFQAEYGNAQSGIINIVTKEGGPDFRGSIRYTTDEQNPRTSDYGYNQLQLAVNGPVLAVPSLYFSATLEIQGRADVSPTHADEGFRGINQDFVNRLNDAVAEDPVLSLPENAFTLEEFQRGHEFYAGQTGGNASLFSPLNPVRLPNNWQDRIPATGKLTYSPIKGLKLFAAEQWSRNQRSYPTGNAGQGNYFQTGIVNRYDPVLSRRMDGRNWGNDSIVDIPQSKGRRVKTSNFISGFNWDFFQSARRSGSLQFRYSRFVTSETNGSSLEVNFDRGDTYLGLGSHDIRFEVENYPDKDTPPLGQEHLYYPNGFTWWLDDWEFASPLAPFRTDMYVITFNRTREAQDNYKLDLDFQLNRRNRLKAGVQLGRFDSFKYWTNFQTTIKANRALNYDPQIAAFYIQNRTDLGDFVFDVGLRYDHFKPKTNWGLHPGDQFAEAYFPKSVDEWSPRFDMAFPVTDRAQMRFSYGTFTQLPSLSLMFSRSNFGELEYSRSDMFEAGISYLLSENILFETVAYYREMDGNVTQRNIFRDYYAFHSEQRTRGLVSAITNRDVGNIKGVDLILQKRFSNNFSLNLNYTLQFSRAMGSEPLGGSSADALYPTQGDRAHVFAGIISYLFPADFRAGTIANTLFKDFRVNAVLTMRSGLPAGNTSVSASGLNVAGSLLRSRWSHNLDLRLNKSFGLGKGRRLQFFTEIFNALNVKAHNPYPKGYNFEPNSHVTGGVEWKWEDLADESGAIRFNADFNQDGVLSVMESTKGEIAQQLMMATMDKRSWGLARQIRFGAEFSF